MKKNKWIILLLLIFFPFLIAVAKSPLVLYSGVPGQIKSGDTIPANIITQGSGSGLDADLLDGSDSSAFGDATAANQTTILGRIGTNADAASMADTLFAGQQYLWDNRTSFGFGSTTVINSIQRGVINTGAGGYQSGNVTITAVTMGKTFLTGFAQTEGGDSTNPTQFSIRLTTTTNLAWFSGSQYSSFAVKISWEVIEFK